MGKADVYCLGYESDIYMNSAKVTGMKILQERQSAAQYMTGNNAYFNQKMQQISNKDFSQIKEVGIFEFANKPVPNIFYFHAAKYDSKQNQLIEEFMMSEVQRFHNMYNTSFAVAYVH